MKTLELCLLGVAAFLAFGCDRNSRPNRLDIIDTKQKASKLSPEAAEAQALAVRLRMKQNASSSPDDIRALRELSPELHAHGTFWKWIGTLPPDERAPFRDYIVSYLKELKPAPGQPVDPQFRDAYRIAKELKDPEIARIALQHLPFVDTYHFPKTPPTGGWLDGSIEGIERLAHGNQGIVATTIVELGDRQTLIEYRKFLRKAPPESQRTLVWALGRSTDVEDFEFLMNMRPEMSDPGAKDTLLRALNRIPQSMEAAGKFPENAPLFRRSEDPAGLLKTAAACKARLEAEGLVVDLTLYD